MTDHEITSTTEPASPPVIACCDPAKQETCCEPSAKADCCGDDPQASSCGC